MSLLHELIAAQLVGGGGGGSVTVDTEISTTSTNPVQNKAIGLAFLAAQGALDGKEDVTSVVNETETAVTITPLPNKYYICDNPLTSLTVTSSPSGGSGVAFTPWSVRFTSGSTATVLTMPNTVVMPDGFEVEANTEYEINVLDNRALVASWPVASS